MAKVVVQKGQVTCPHQGHGTLASLPAKDQLTVDGSSVLTTSSTGDVAFPDCQNPQLMTGGKACSKIVSWTGTSTLLEVGGEPVIIDNSVPMTDVPPQTGSVQSAGQDKLEVNG